MKNGIVLSAVGIGPHQYMGWCSGADHLAPVDPETGKVLTHPTMPPLRDVCHGSGEMSLEIARPFFVPGRTYQHEVEGTFKVDLVGRAPKEFEDPSETLGVAFGWRIDRHGEPLGAYTEADFVGWSEVDR